MGSCCVLLSVDFALQLLLACAVWVHAFLLDCQCCPRAHGRNDAQAAFLHDLSVRFTRSPHSTHRRTIAPEAASDRPKQPTRNEGAPHSSMPSSSSQLQWILVRGPDHVMTSWNNTGPTRCKSTNSQESCLHQKHSSHRGLGLRHAAQ